MVIRGFAHKFGDNINTDYIISGKYKFKTLDMDELAKHIMEDIYPDFYKKIKKGDFIVAGKNFGCGSSREQAPLVIKHAGIQGVISKSFARIFYRNAINNGLILIESNTDLIDDGDEIEVILEDGIIKNLTKKIEIKGNKIPEFLIEIIKEGGVINYLQKYGGFKIK
ncbi:MAG: 3-isopropylmalate dehydratase small subunit [bacterium]|nr:3-isopropylmalate dehydratase small subunit [bacterium]MCX7916657.1 3-isopropylmalate dehydratase small subunit [bacterium]MDW8163488.1 3-isopropylmalate dehydratase small subunit [Candidatus Omnitrophota bacterium]